MIRLRQGGCQKISGGRRGEDVEAAEGTDFFRLFSGKKSAFR